ncbi:MAG: iron ABC transporter permease [Thermodesulfobacteriota bacterium]|nr:iron ABC transporter permease [Thermodesulfobacteriota bacterium]
MDRGDIIAFSEKGKRKIHKPGFSITPYSLLRQGAHTVKGWKNFGIRPVVIAGLIPLLFLSLFYFYPLCGIFTRSFFPDGIFEFKVFEKIFSSARIARIIWFTFWQAGLSTLLTMAAALPCAFVMANYHFKGKKIIMGIATIPFVLPTVVVASAFQALAGDRGIIGFIHIENSLYMILLAHVFYNFSIVLRITTNFWSYIRKETAEAGAMLGASSVQIFFKITLPLLKPALYASSILVFIFCFSSFGVILILGGPYFSTIEVEIYRQAAHLFNLPVASLLSLIQILFTFLMMWVYTSLQKRMAKFSPESESKAMKHAETFQQKIMVGFCLGFICLLCFLPMAALVVKSLLYEGSFSFTFYKELFINSTNSLFYIFPLKAGLNSLVYATATLAMALVVGLCASFLIKSAKGKRGALLDSFFMLPLSTSAVTLGFGIIITLDKPPLNLRTSWILVPVVHTLVAFPFVVRSVLPALSSIPESLRDAALMLGASNFRVWFHVDLPIIARAVTAGALFAFTISLGEFGATIFTARPEFSTLPVAIYRFLGQPGIMNYGQAMAVSSLLMLVTAAGFLVIENIRTMGNQVF